MKLQRHREEQTRHCEREKQQNQSIYVILLQFSLHMQDSARERETTTLLSFIACRCAHAPRHPQQQHQLACTQIKAKTNEQHQAITSRAETREKESRMDMWVFLSLSLFSAVHYTTAVHRPAGNSSTQTELYNESHHSKTQQPRGRRLKTECNIYTQPLVFCCCSIHTGVCAWRHISKAAGHGFKNV